jgi:hypothetical protein
MMKAGNSQDRAVSDDDGEVCCRHSLRNTATRHEHAGRR